MLTGIDARVVPANCSIDCVVEKKGGKGQHDTGNCLCAFDGDVGCLVMRGSNRPTCMPHVAEDKLLYNWFKNGI